MKVGLVLEGGGMRGFYTMGALDYLMEQGILFDYVIGVSAGACHGVSYVSNQAKRSYRVNTNYLGDKRYISFSNFIKTRSIFGMDFIFDEVPHKLDLFDYDTFFKSPCEFKLGVTDVETGKPVYFDKTALDHDCNKVVVILTRDRHYQKSPEQFRFVYKRVFKKYPKMIELLDNRHKNYNETLAYLRELESEGKALVIAPSHPITISRFEKHKENLEPIYAMGRKDLSKEILKIKELLKKA